MPIRKANIAWKASVHRVVLDKIRHIFRIEERIVDPHDVQILTLE